MSCKTGLRLYLTLLFILSFSWSQGQSSMHNIIPEPVVFAGGKGYFSITPATQVIISPVSEELTTLAGFLSERLGLIQHQDGAIKKPAEKHNTITLKLSQTNEPGEEGYSITVDRKNITITARRGNGIFYGIQTLFQLMPPEIEDRNPGVEFKKIKVPVCSILDYPRFKYRGMHLDVCRHFFTVDFIKKYIDLLSMYKINNFHWHLTEDQGWRLEIMKYPLLTEIGAWRSSTPVGHNTRDDNKPYGGFYTQAEAREIVAYASSRYVNIIPEIEMPGHALAALAAYPELSCTGGPFEVWTRWGVTDDIFCAGNEKTFEFIEDVLTEVMDIFPSTYIHIGGDEAPKSRWEACTKCQQRMNDEYLKNTHELQGYFVARIEKFLNRNGRKIIGWDEILEGGTSQDATIMSWRGIEGGIAAAKSGKDVVMTPGSPCYFDHFQGNPSGEPLAFGGYNPLKKVYNYEPVPDILDSLEAMHILGSQGNLWTEYIPSAEQAEYMAFPRAIALAEVNWSAKKSRNWTSFSERLIHHFDRLRARNVNFSESSLNVDIKTIYDSVTNQWKVQLESDVPESQIYYSTGDPQNPALNQQYNGPFILSETAEVKAGIRINGKFAGKTCVRTIYVHDGFGRKPVLNTLYNYRYPAAGPSSLTDGLRAHPLALRNDWLGYLGDNADLVIDLGKTTEIDNINIGFLHNPANWIFLPTEVTITLSTDGINYLPAGGIRPELLTIREPVTINYNQIGIDTLARYIRIVAKNRMECPQNHPGAGEKAWLFLDEVLINMRLD